MKFDLFSEIQKRDCDANGGFPQLLQESLAQAQAGEAAGFTCWWEVEHHCTPDFSYSSCPELMLSAIANATRTLRVGHAGILAPFNINHPLRVAERVAMLDQLSGGRIEVGLAKSGGKEWETFGITEDEANADLVELTRLLPHAWQDENFSWNSDRWQVEDRNVQPRVVQGPYPNLWHTCSSPDSFKRAGQLGVGVLGTTLFAPVDAFGGMLEGYRAAIAESDNPNTNNQAGVFTFVHARKSVKAAIDSGAPRSALWYVSSAPRVFRVPREIFYRAIRGQTDPRSAPSAESLQQAETPDPTDVTDSNPVVALMKREFVGEEISNEEIYETLKDLDSFIVGGVEECRRKVARYQEIGVDRLMCLVQMGEVAHTEVLETIGVIGEELIPEFSKE
ncbi:MAG: LLM class flavin-dependent oxidoreductase [Pseudomonadales bacterium]